MMSEKKGEHLERGLKNRHIQMIALGGAIGTGLFYGSGEAIALTGPSIILAYIIGGAIIYMIMRMLGEMATQEPVSGAFSHFAYKYWGPFPGFLAGWNYWLLYILVSMVELTVIGAYVHYWLPEFPPWITSLAVLVFITLINLMNVKLYGEFEFWFALLKVVTIVCLIVLGGIVIFFGLNGPAVGFTNLWGHGGFFPKGSAGLLMALTVVMFSFGGTELVGIAAGEADDPRTSIPRAVKQVMWRILIFYIGALIVIMCIMPWTDISTKESLMTSPFVLIFTKIGIPAAAHIMNFVVLTAAISVYNSGIYSNGRMLYSLAEQGNAPKLFMKLNANKIPQVAVLFSSLCTLLVVVVNYLVPDGAFMRIMSLATAAALITWMMIALVHLFFRQKMVAKNEAITFKSPLYPVANFICVAFFLMIIALLYINGSHIAVYAIPAWIGVLFIGFLFKSMSGSTTKAEV